MEEASPGFLLPNSSFPRRTTQSTRQVGAGVGPAVNQLNEHWWRTANIVDFKTHTRTLDTDSYQPVRRVPTPLSFRRRLAMGEKLFSLITGGGGRTKHFIGLNRYEISLFSLTWRRQLAAKSHLDNGHFRGWEVAFLSCYLSKS